MSEMDGRVDSLDSVSLGSPRDHGRLCGVTEIGGVGGAFGGLVCSFSMLNAPGTLGMVRIPGGTALGRASSESLCLNFPLLKVVVCLCVQERGSEKTCLAVS